MKTRITMIHKMDACLRRQVRRPGEQVIMTERRGCMGLAWVRGEGWIAVQSSMTLAQAGSHPAVLQPRRRRDARGLTHTTQIVVVIAVVTLL